MLVHLSLITWLIDKPCVNRHCFVVHHQGRAHSQVSEDVPSDWGASDVSYTKHWGKPGDCVTEEHRGSAQGSWGTLGAVFTPVVRQAHPSVGQTSHYLWHCGWVSSGQGNNTGLEIETNYKSPQIKQFSRQFAVCSGNMIEYDNLFSKMFKSWKIVAKLMTLITKDRILVTLTMQ